MNAYRPTLLLLACLALITSACRQEAAQSPAPTQPVVVAPAAQPTAQMAPPALEPPVLQVYDLPAGYGDSVLPILDSLLVQGEGAARLGRLSRLPGHQVALLAPQSVHNGIAGLLERISAADPPKAPEAVSMTYWLVAARPAATSNAGQLADVAPALESLVEAMGPMEFALVERSQLLSLNGESAEVQGRLVHIHQRVSALTGHDENLIGDLRINTRRGAEIQTRINITPKQTLVLGQSGFRPDPDDAIFPDQIGLPKPGEALSLFFIVRAEPTAP